VAPVACYKSYLVAVDKVAAASKDDMDTSNGYSPCNNHCIASLYGSADLQKRLDLHK